MFTVSVAVLVDGNHLKGLMFAALGDQTYRRDIDVKTAIDPKRFDPPFVMSLLMDGITDVAALATDHTDARPHGWSMPYRSPDGHLMQFEVDFDS